MAMSCDHPDLLPLDEALSRLWEALPVTTLSEVRAGRDDPATDRASMDGAALRASEGRSPRRVLGTLYAGDDPAGFVVAPGTAVRIMTGAAMPPGADAIVPVEQLQTSGNTTIPLIDPKPGDHVNARGSSPGPATSCWPREHPSMPPAWPCWPRRVWPFHPPRASGSAWPPPGMNSFRTRPPIRSVIPTDLCSWPSPAPWGPRSSSAPPCPTTRSLWPPRCASPGTSASCSPPGA